MSRVTPRGRYGQHRRNAKERNIPFLLTFDEWWNLWRDSGHWDQYGVRKGQYCMSRPSDKGAYEIGNVRICLAEENRAERNRNYPYDKPKSAAHRAAIAAALKGKPKSAEHRAKFMGERNPMYGKSTWAGYTPEQRAARLAAANRDRDGRFAPMTV